MGGELHFYLETVAFEANFVEFHRLEHATLVALETGGGVVDFETCDETHVFRRKIRHQHATDRPIHHVHAADITRADGEVEAFVVAGGIEARQVGGVV